MPTLACAMEGIYGCGSLFPLPFLLKEKEQKFKADIIGPNTQSGRFPAMSAVARAPDPVEVWRFHTESVVIASMLNSITHHFQRNYLSPLKKQS